ncbi:Pre-mRNA-splicing factor 38A [Tritrichomonas musculus]|uniref:Pre-mRNA-splicing factor 38 n=1 Tax=Tritrichomonas musculus TaxID=1915356 RepID=A0ABR2IZV9_9EUKA
MTENEAQEEQISQENQNTQEDQNIPENLENKDNQENKESTKEKKSSDYVFPAWSHIQNYKKAIRGMAPQHLLDPKTRHKIYESVFWLQYCFGVNLVTLVDRAQLLQGVGGLYGQLKAPCNFLCLFLKLLELEPSEEVIRQMLNTKSWQMKNLRLLAALYVRFTYPCEQVYLILEPLLQQYNKVAILKNDGWEITYFDVVIQSFIKEDFWCGVSFPPLTPRVGIPPRLSPLSHLLDKIHDEVYEELGMDPSGELFEVLQEKQKLKIRGLIFKNKTKGKKKKKKSKSKAGEQEQNQVNEIEEENKLRAMLGLPLLH